MTEMDELKPCPFDVDELAGEIRYVDPENALGAGALAEALMPFLRASLSPAGVTEEQRDMIEQIVSGTAPMSKWMGSVDYSTFDGFEAYLEGQLREKLFLKVTLDKEREHSAENESLATFVDGAIGVIESALATFRTVREREAAAKAQPSAASDGWQDISTAPKDGTAFLVWCPDLRNSYLVIPKATDDPWVSFGGGELPVWDRPTHWRPLPSPPSSKGEGCAGRRSQLHQGVSHDLR